MVQTNRFERGKLLLKEHLPCRCSQAFWTNLKFCLNLARVAELTEMKLRRVILYRISKCGRWPQGRILVEIMGEVEKKLGETWRCSGIAYDPHGKLGLRMGQSRRRDVCASSVHMYQCIN